MRRLVIMVIYCDDGKLMSYKQKLIDDIRPYADTLHIVCNGTILEDGYDFLAGRADIVMIRENTGYDAGAYKDVLMKMDLHKYDELLLMNDTFFGFFYSLDDFFGKVYEFEEVDFWGLTRHPDGENNDGKFREHIQSYFLLVRHRMLHDKLFKDFFERMPYPATIDEAIAEFELNFTAYFESYGYRGEAAYCDLDILHAEYNENPYLCYPYELIHEQKCPVLKLRTVSFVEFEIVWKIMQYIDKCTDYDISMIREVLDKRCRENPIEFAKTRKLEEFYDSRNKVYLYGHGKIAANVAAYFQYRGWKFEGFLVSAQTDEDVSRYGDVEIQEQDGIVLALGRRASEEVYPVVKRDLQPQQIFRLSY